MDSGTTKFTVPYQAINSSMPKATGLNFRSIDIIVFWEGGVAGREVLEGPIISQCLYTENAYSALQSSDKLSTGKSHYLSTLNFYLPDLRHLWTLTSSEHSQMKPKSLGVNCWAFRVLWGISSIVKIHISSGTGIKLAEFCFYVCDQ